MGSAACCHPLIAMTASTVVHIHAAVHVKGKSFVMHFPPKYESAKLVRDHKAAHNGQGSPSS